MVASSKLTDQVKLTRATVAKVVNPVELQALRCFSDADCTQVIEQLDRPIPLVSFHPFNYSIDDGLVENPDPDIPRGESEGVNSRSSGIGSSASTGTVDRRLSGYHKDTYKSSAKKQLRQRQEIPQQSLQQLAGNTSSPANSPSAIGEATSLAIDANGSNINFSELSRLLGEIERLSSKNNLRSSEPGVGIQTVKSGRMSNRSRLDQSTYTKIRDIKSSPQQMDGEVFSAMPIFETIQQLMDSYTTTPTRETAQLNLHSSSLAQLTDHFFGAKKQSEKPDSTMARPIDSFTTSTIDTLHQLQHEDKPGQEKSPPKSPLGTDSKIRENHSQDDAQRAQQSSAQGQINEELLNTQLLNQPTATDAINQPLFSRDLSPSETQKLVDALSEYLQQQASLHGVDLL